MRFSKLLFLVLVLAFLLRVPFFSVPLDYDEGTYAFFAFFSRGEKFYSSLPIARLPGIIFTYRFLDTLFPGQIAAFRIAAAFLAVLATFWIYKLGKLLYDQNTGILSALVFALLSPQISLESPANAEFFMMPFTVSAFYLFWLFQKSGRSFWLILSGFSAGIAIFYKQVAVFEIALLGLWLLIGNIERRKIESLIKQWPIFGIPFLTPFFASLLYFGLRGELADFWWQSFGSGGGYWVNAWSGWGWFGRLNHTIKFLWHSLWPFWLTSFGGLIIALTKLRKESVFLLAWLLFALIGTFFNGWFFPHYFVQLIPALSLLSGIFVSKFFGWKRIAVLVLFCLMLKNPLPHYLSYGQMLRGEMDKVEYFESIGFDVGDSGWLPFYGSADYLQGKMKRGDTLFVWSTTPVSYYLTRKYATTSFVYNYPFLDYPLMLPTYRGWHFDFEANRQRLMRELVGDPPDYVLASVNPEQIFDQMLLFGDFSNFVSRNYEFEKKFGNIFVYKKFEERPELSEGKVIPLEIVKRFAAIIDVEKNGEQTAITLEPMVNPGGVLRSFRAVYPEPVKLDFEPLSVEFLGADGRDFVSHAVFKPSGVVDLHIKVEGLPKLVSFVRVKTGNLTWNNRSYGVNRPLKVVQRGEIFDLYFEPPSDWEEKEFEVYLIYEDGSLAR